MTLNKLRAGAIAVALALFSLTTTASADDSQPVETADAVADDRAVEPQALDCSGRLILWPAPQNLRIYGCGFLSPSQMYSSSLYPRITAAAGANKNNWLKVDLRNSSGQIVATRSGARSQWVQAPTGSGALRAYCIDGSGYQALFQCGSEFP